jgi:uncharacterized membrane protein YccC
MLSRERPSLPPHAVNSISIHPDVREDRSWFDFTTTGDIVFALRTTLAGFAALFTAMWLQLDIPRWAMFTVFLLSPPVRGNALRKTAARLVGTVIGCIVAVGIVALFPQERVPFYLVFSLWLGGCAYWATLRRGYVSYAAILAAFTSAIISSDVSSAPLGVWRAAVDRGSATLLGTIFAYFASEMLARSDDVPSDLANRVRALAGDVLDWAVRQLESRQTDEPKDAPFTARIFALDETCTNAIAERPALGWVKPWIVGLPTALLAFQSAVLRMSSEDSRETEPAATALLKKVLETFAAFLRSTAPLDLPSVRQQARSLANAQKDLSSENLAAKEIIAAILSVVASFEVVLTLRPPADAVPPYPKPTFVTHRDYAATNLIRTVAGILLGFVIWNVTAWSHGDTFMVNVAVALVLFVAMDDPIAANWRNLLGNLTGGLIALAAKYLALVQTSELLTFVIVLFPLLFLGAWTQTKPTMASFGVFYVNGLLIVSNPSNPQQYDFTQDVNVLIALVVGYSFVPMIFLAIGAPRHGAERVADLLMKMRRQQRRVAADSTRNDRLARETQMYDEFQRLQAETDQPQFRECAVNLLIAAY